MVLHRRVVARAGASTARPDPVTSEALTSEDSVTSIDRLAADLRSVELDVRRDAAYELAKRGPDALPAIDAFIEGLRDPRRTGVDAIRDGGGKNW